MTVTVLWTGRSTNGKTGDIPTAFIGKDREEAIRSCQGCPLLHVRDGGQAEAGSGTPMCHAHYGTQAFAHKAYRKRYENGEDLSLEAALANSLRSADYIRVSALGDATALTAAQIRHIVETAKEDRKGILGYVHMWRRYYRDSEKARLLRQHFMASCNSIEEADAAIEAGWVPTAIVPPDHPHGFQRTPGGNPAILCPHAIDPSIQCNTCGLCDPQKNKATVILLVDNGPTSPARRKGFTKPDRG